LQIPHNILNIWKNYFFQLLNVCGISDVRQSEMHTAETLFPEAETVIEKLERCKSPGTDQISKQVVIYFILRSTNLLIVFGIRKNFHSSGRNLLYLFIKMVIE